MAYLELNNIVKRFGDMRVVEDVSLAAETGEFIVLVGASGCGKSTTLRMIAGLEAPSSGQILIDGRDVSAVPPAKRDIAMVFQNYALYPHMDVARNMGFALELARVPRAEIDSRVTEAARILGIGHLLERKPKELSGGQRQRVAMGRAIVREPKVFLFDEPLSNLDAKLRGQMRVEIALLHRRLGKTTVYVTHDQIEAMTLADRIVVMDQGRIQQIGSPDDVFNHPVNQFVAGFIGSPAMNFLPVRVCPAAGGLQFAGAGFTCAVPPTLRTRAAQLVGGQAVLGLRPQAIQLGAEDTWLALPVRVEVTEYLGTETVLSCRLRDEPQTQVTVMAPGRHVGLTGQHVTVGAPTAALYAFEPDSHGRTLSSLAVVP